MAKGRSSRRRTRKTKSESIGSKKTPRKKRGPTKPPPEGVPERRNQTKRRTIRPRRRNRRLGISKRVDYTFKGKKTFGYTKDLSARGMFVRTSKVPPERDTVDFVIKLEQGYDPVTIKGKIVRTAKGKVDNGMAVTFLDEPLEARATIAAFVLDRLEERELERLESKPDSIKSLENLGDICAERGDPDGATEYYERALELDPSTAWARTRLAYLTFAHADETGDEQLYRDTLHHLEIAGAGNAELRELRSQCDSALEAFETRRLEADKRRDTQLNADRRNLDEQRAEFELRRAELDDEASRLGRLEEELADREQAIDARAESTDRRRAALEIQRLRLAERLRRSRSILQAKRRQVDADRVEKLEGAAKRDAESEAATRRQRDDVTRERERLEERHRALETGRDELVAAQAELAGERDKLNSERGVLESSRDELVGAQVELASERTAIADERQAAQQERQALTALRLQLGTERDKLAARHDELANLKTKLKSSQAVLDTERVGVTAKEDELDDERARLLEAQDALQALQRKLADALQQLTETQEAYRQERGRLSAVSADAEASRITEQESAARETQRQALETRLQREQDRAMELEHDLVRSRREASEAAESSRQKGEERRRVQADQEEAAVRATMLEHELGAMRLDHERMTGELAAARAELALRDDASSEESVPAPAERASQNESSDGSTPEAIKTQWTSRDINESLPGPFAETTDELEPVPPVDDDEEFHQASTGIMHRSLRLRLHVFWLGRVSPALIGLRFAAARHWRAAVAWWRRAQPPVRGAVIGSTALVLFIVAFGVAGTLSFRGAKQEAPVPVPVEQPTEIPVDLAPPVDEKLTAEEEALLKPPPPKHSRLSLSREEIVVGFNAAPKKKLRNCWASARRRGAMRAGQYTFVFGWIVREDGSVVDAELMRPVSLVGTKFARCVSLALNAWRFPASKRESIVRNFPYGPLRVR